MKMLKRCGFKDVLSEYRYRGSARVGKDDSRRVPDVTCVHPDTVKEYVIGARIFRNITAPQHRWAYAPARGAGSGSDPCVWRGPPPCPPEIREKRRKSQSFPEK